MWTGTELLLLRLAGASPASGGRMAYTGAAYNPLTRAWRTLPAVRAATAGNSEGGGRLVWTGRHRRRHLHTRSTGSHGENMTASQDTSRPGAVAAFARSAIATGRLLATGRVASPRAYLGRRLGFADGTTSFVFRETAIRDRDPRDPAVLVVQFRLRGFGHRRWLHALFRRECILHTPLFAGFPGFRSKLWISDTATGTYRGLYEWDGAGRAADYAHHLVRLLNPLSTRGSVRYHVVPGIRRQDLFAASGLAVAGQERGADGWWRLAEPLDAATARSS